MLFNRLMIVIIALLAIGAVADASLYYTGDTVLIAEEDTLRENVMLTGETVSIYADIFGDVISACRNYNQYADVHENVFVAARSVFIQGNVDDLLALGQTLDVKSDTTGDIRGAAQTLNIFAYVDGDVIAGAETVYIAPGAVVTGDVFVGASEITILGEVLGDVKGGIGQLTVGNTIHGDVEVWTDDITFISDGEVLGDLEYHAEEEYEWYFSDSVRGRISFSQCCVDEKDVYDPLFGFAFGFLLLVTALVSAFLLLAAWKRGVEGSLIAMDQRLGAVILAGIVGFAATPVAAILALIMVITFPVGLILLTIYPVLMYLGWLIFAIWLGKLLLDGLLRRDVSLWAATPLGVLILGTLVYVPYVGLFIALISTIMGMGMLIIQMIGLRTLRTW